MRLSNGKPLLKVTKEPPYDFVAAAIAEDRGRD